jgi:hypothetical protein
VWTKPGAGQPAAAERPSALIETAKIENRPSELAEDAPSLTSYQLFTGEFRYLAEQWNFETEQRNFGLAGSRNSAVMAKINERSANR